jgi:hypothetical protein
MVKPTGQFSMSLRGDDPTSTAQNALRGLPIWAALVNPSADPDRGAVRLSRRALLRGASVAAGALGAAEVLAACGADKSQGGAAGAPGGQAAAGSLRGLAANLPQLSILNAQSQLPVSHSRFAFGLSAENNRLVEGVTPRVWFAQDPNGPALGPFQAQWLELDAYDKTHDHSPRSDLRGFYVADVDLPKPGNWLVVAIVEVATQRSAAQGSIPVSQGVAAQVGAKAISGKTPVATSPREIAKICTREPVCPLHDVSLDQALRSGKPTVLSFATPLLCSSRMCGPVIDEVMLTAQKLGKDKANLIHLEIYPQRDTGKPAPLYKAWGLQSEPWTVVIDRDGIIRARSEGPMVASEIQAALQPML